MALLETNPAAGRDHPPPLPDLAGVAAATAVEVIPAPEAGTHPVAVYLARLAPGSRRTMRQALDVVAGLLTDGHADATTLPWPQLRYQHTQAVRSRLAERYQPATVNKSLAAVRGVLKEAWRLGLIPADDYHRAVDLRGIPAHTLPRGRALSAGEIRALFTACALDRSTAGARDAAMLALLYGAGMRRQEVVRLDVADFDGETGAVTIRAGKGRKDRTAYTSNGSLTALQAWLAVRGEKPGPLFVPVMKGGRGPHRATSAGPSTRSRRQSGQRRLSPRSQDSEQTGPSRRNPCPSEIVATQACLHATRRYPDLRKRRRDPARSNRCPPVRPTACLIIWAARFFQRGVRLGSA